MIAGWSPLEHFPWEGTNIHETKRLEKTHAVRYPYRLQRFIWVLTPICHCHPLAGKTSTSVQRCRSKRFEAMSRCESADVYLRAWAYINQTYAHKMQPAFSWEIPLLESNVSFNKSSGIMRAQLQSQSNFWVLRNDWIWSGIYRRNLRN